jgi:cell division septation protein DedD
LSGEKKLQEREPSREKRIIIDDLAAYEQETGVTRSMRKRGGVGEFIKSLFVFLLLVGIVVGSFWVSFLLGKKVLLPVRQLEVKDIAPIEETLPESAGPIEPEKLKIAVPTSTVVEEEELEPAAKVVKPTTLPLEQNKYYKVQAGLFKTKADASALVDRLKLSGFTAFIRKLPDGSFKVQAGAFRARSQAQAIVNQLSVKRFESIIIYE